VQITYLLFAHYSFSIYKLKKNARASFGILLMFS